MKAITSTGIEVPQNKGALNVDDIPVQRETMQTDRSLEVTHKTATQQRV
jgi:hypothetical protein